MFDQGSAKKPHTLNKLVRLYELRQNKARKEYQQQQSSVAVAQAKVDRRERDYQGVVVEAEQLNFAAYSDELASNLRVQQQIQIKRRWLKYDSEKTEYFLNDARCDLTTEQEEADRLRSQWMQLRSRCEKFQDQHRIAIKGNIRSQEMTEEHDQEDEALGLAVGGQHHG